MKKWALPLLLFVGIQLKAQPPSKNGKSDFPPAFTAILQHDLHDDLYRLASNTFRGRRACTIDELNGAAWIAEQARKAGLQPAGDNGTYFQFFPIQRAVVDEKSSIQINNKNFVLWKDAWVTEPIDVNLDNNIMWLSSIADTAKPDINGSVVAMKILPPSSMPPLTRTPITTRCKSPCSADLQGALRLARSTPIPRR